MICALFLLLIANKVENLIERYIVSVTIWTLYMFMVTEILSVVQRINIVTLWICWAVFDVMVGTYVIICHKFQVCIKKEKLEISKGMVIYTVFAIFIVLIALRTIPYNWDSMTYNLPRIYHWAQNGSVAHFATHIDRQVSSPVLGSFVNLHVYTMMGNSDIFINMLQCCSFLTNGILVYYIAKKIKCSVKYCCIASVLFYTMPIAFAEAFTTQVDNYAALWMLCFTYIFLDFIVQKEKLCLDKRTLFKVCILSLCVAFGYLAKPSVGFGLVFMLMWLLIVVIKRRDKIQVLVVYGLVAAGTIFLVLFPEFLRNIETFQALASAGTGQRQLIGSLHLKHWLVNFVKNFTYNLPTVWIYDSSFLIWKYVMRFSKFLEIDIDNPAISEDGREFQVRDPQTYGNSSAINPMIVWLTILVILLFLFYNWRKKRSAIQNQYFVVSCSSFLFFCMVLRWEPFISRYMISYLAILCPAIAGQLEFFFEDRVACAGKMANKFTTILYFLCITEFLGMIYYHGKIAMDQNDILSWENCYGSE